MQKLLLTVAIAMMAAMNVNAQLSDDTQGVGGLVLDSLYTTDNSGARSMKYVYEYTEAKLPVVKQELAYFDEYNRWQEEPRLTGYETYSYDDQNRMQRLETWTEVEGTFRLSSIEEIAEFDAATGLAALIYAYNVDELDPDATPELTQKAVTTKYHGTVGIEDAEVYRMAEGEWMLLGTMHYDYDENGLVVQEVMSFGGYYIVTDYEYDDHGHMTREVVQERADFNGEIIVISNVDMTFTNEYYDDGNLKSSAEYDDGTYIETSHYFWGSGVTTAISRMESGLETIDRFYDLNGLSRIGRPSHKGLYIYRGRKVFLN